ncbi:MAG TPA: peroxidase [Dehalococcoidia bacterium]|nr:peroxidase [Dehalococcoidia bacterium]
MAKLEDAVALYKDFRSLDLPENERLMLEFAEKLTASPSSVSEEDIKALRAAGFSDENILDIVLVTANRNFVNRLHLALGLPLDPLRERFGEIVDAIAAP